jgi:hydrogenase expression/formation protein HypD
VKYVDDFRDPARLRRAVDNLARATTRPWTVMEICGGQTHTIARWALAELLPAPLAVIHGPGCPVCVTPLEVIEAARALALRAGVILCSFGDMLRVPGVRGDLFDARARGADVRVVLSPLDAVRLAEATPDSHVVFFGVGFETTAPATAMAAELARRLDLGNFSLLAAHVRVPPAMERLLALPSCRVQGFLAAGHVCTVTGTGEYPAIAARYRVPIVVTGFEPLDILHGLAMLVAQLEEGRAEVENQYARSVREEGNTVAREMTDAVFEVADRTFRGLGVVPSGGLRLREAFSRWDAERRFDLALAPIAESGRCRAAEVLQGLLVPTACPEFGGGCTPDHPLGAPMVSTEGACSAYFRYRRQRAEHL